MTLDDILNKFRYEYPDYEIIFLTQYGSHLYGFNTEKSDADYKGVFVPSNKSLILDKAISHWSYSTGTDSSKNSKDDIDVELFSIHKFLDMLIGGQTNALDINFANSAPEWNVISTPKWEYVTNNSNKLITRNLKSFFGYCVGQASKYGIKGERLQELKKLISFIGAINQDGRELRIADIIGLIDDLVDLSNMQYIKINSLPEADYLYVLGRNYILNIKLSELLIHLKNIESRYGNRVESASKGVDLKSMSHAFRILAESEELITTGRITFPVKNANFIKDVRADKLTPDELYNKLDVLLDRVRTLEATENVLPEKTDINLRDGIVLYFYQGS